MGQLMAKSLTAQRKREMKLLLHCDHSLNGGILLGLDGCSAMRWIAGPSWR